MTPNVVFIGYDEDDDDLAYVYAHLARHGVTGRRVHPEELTFLGGPEGARVLEGGKDFVAELVVGWVFETWLTPGGRILEMLEAAGYRVLNQARTLQNGQNKVSMSFLLAAAGVAHGRTFTSFNPEGLETVLAQGNQTWVVKPGFVDCGGFSICTSGKGVAKLQEPAALNALQTALGAVGQPLYAQEYFDREDNADFRLWLFGDGTHEGVRKVPTQGGWITNTSQGVQLETFTPDEECLEIASKAARAIGAQIAGLDLARTGGGWKVIEVNTCPTFLPALDLLGETVPERFAAFLVRVLGDKGWVLS